MEVNSNLSASGFFILNAIEKLRTEPPTRETLAAVEHLEAALRWLEKKARLEAASQEVKAS